MDHLQEKKDIIPENYPIEFVEAKISFPLKAEDNQDIDEKISSLIHRVDGIWTCTAVIQQYQETCRNPYRTSWSSLWLLWQNV